MYSQQEYDMVRRQTMQIEAEKRTLLRWALITVTVLLAVSLVLTGWMYRRFSLADNLIKNAESEAANANSQLQQANRELAEKRAILEKNAAALAKQNAVIEATVPKMLSRAASESEMAELAQAIYDQPGHLVVLPSIPPNEVLRSYRARIDGRSFKYTIVPGLLDGKWVIYSLLVKNQED
jgi:cell division protein FtsB